jgi:F420-dependent oxidoreductase-like protein
VQLGVFTERGRVEDLVADAREAAGLGYGSMWLPQIFGMDALTSLAVVSHEVPELRFGTAVVPTYPRHPLMLAAQARTVQQVSGGRLTLGIGLSHQMVIENMFGMSWDKPVRHMREYLEVLMPLVRGEAVSVSGDVYKVQGALTVASDPVPVIVAALGEQMLKVSGRLADGTATWMTGEATLREHIAPVINAAAEKAGNPQPQVMVALPTCVTDDVEDARARAAQIFQIYGHLPSYRAMLDREGAAGPEDVALIGSADQVQAAIASLFEAGATEFVVVPFQRARGDAGGVDPAAGLSCRLPRCGRLNPRSGRSR